MSVATPETLDHDAILARIYSLESELVVLRSQLDDVSPVRSVFSFRCRPQSFCYVYAGDSAEAKAKAIARMDRDYPKGWEFTSVSVRTLAPDEAARDTASNLFRCLSKEDAQLLLDDLASDRQGRAKERTEPGAVPVPLSQLEKDEQDYLCYLRMKEAR